MPASHSSDSTRRPLVRNGCLRGGVYEPLKSKRLLNMSKSLWLTTSSSNGGCQSVTNQPMKQGKYSRHCKEHTPLVPTRCDGISRCNLAWAISFSGQDEAFLLR